MNIHQLHQPNKGCSDWQECSPCEASPRPESAKYWPKVNMRRCYLSNSADERLSIQIINPHPELILRHVKIAFLSADPNAQFRNGMPPVKFAPAHGIEFGEIAYHPDPKQAGVVRNIIMVEHQPNPEGQQIYAGIAFTAYSKSGEVKHYGYLLFRSGLLLGDMPLDQAA